MSFSLTFKRNSANAFSFEGLVDIESNNNHNPAQNGDKHSTDQTDDKHSSNALPWGIGVNYQQGDKVIFTEDTYTCLQSHTSNEYWDPNQTRNILWTPGEIAMQEPGNILSINERAVEGLSDSQVYIRCDVGAVLSFDTDTNVKHCFFNNMNIVKRNGPTSFKVTKDGSGCLKIVFHDDTIRLVGVYSGDFQNTKQLTIGSVSEDDPLTSISFWSSFGDSKSTSKYCQVRYIYLNGGPFEYGWRMNYTSKEWNTEPLGKRCYTFIRNSHRLGMIPCFVYYNIPDNGESYITNLEHIQSKDYMTAYYDDLMCMLNIIKREGAGLPVYIVFEPDFLGYLMQNSGKGMYSDYFKLPKEIKAFVSPVYANGYLDTDVDPLFEDNVEGLVKCVNYLVAKHCKNVKFGWQINVWSSSYSGKWIPSQSLMRVTDKLGIEEGVEFIKKEAQEIASYYENAGVTYLSHFISVDKYGLSFRGVDATSLKDAEKSLWGWNHDHWMNYLDYCGTLSQTLQLPCVLWQIPSAHLNKTLTVSPYTGKTFEDIANVPGAFEDSSITFFFGDTFKPQSHELVHWAKDERKTGAVSKKDAVLTWKPCINQLKDYNIFMFLSGAGVGMDTHSGGLARPITDHLFFIYKLQKHYEKV